MHGLPMTRRQGAGLATRSRTVFATCAAALLLVIAATGCERIRDNAQQHFSPNVEGVLTVATTLPAPGFWHGDDVSSLDGGFEWSIATALAERFDLDLRVIDVPFDSLVAGDLDGADLAMSQITITDDRSQVVDFSTPYFKTSAGILGRADADPITDLKTAREQRWVVVEATTEAALVHDIVRPDTAPLVVDNDQAAADAVAAGDADVALLDLSSGLVLANNDARLEVLAHLATAQWYGIALPHGSTNDNREAVDAAVRALEANGSLTAFTDEWLEPEFSTDITDIPVIQI